MKKSSKNTIKRRLSTEKPYSKSALSVKKKRINLKDDIRQDRPLSEKETHRLKRKLRNIESATLYEKGLNRISGGFSKTIVGESDRDTIDVTLVYGVEGTSSEEEKIVINRKTMDRVSKENGGSMAHGGKTGIVKKLIGKKVVITSDNENYDEYKDKELIITHAEIGGRGYDDSVYPEALVDLKVADTGEQVPFALYEYEFNIIGNKSSGGSMETGGNISPEKARKILHDGEVHGKPLTEEQRKFFGARASGYPVKRKEEGGYMANGGDIKTDLFPPKFGINASDKWLAIVYEDGVVGDNEYFTSESDAKKWLQEKKGGSMATGGSVNKITYPTERLPVKEQSIEERELQLFIENDADLYRQRTVPIQTNLVTKIARGEFDINKAPLIYKYLIDDGIKKYNKELGPGMSLTKEEKDNLAKTFVNEFLDEAQNGSYENYLPKKYNPKEGGSMAEGGSVEDSGKYQINVQGEKPEDYKIVCTITRSGGKEVQVCYSERNDKKKKAVEIYSGKNYIHGSKDPSFSKKYDLDEVPVKYKEVVRELKKEHNKRFADGKEMKTGGNISDFDVNSLVGKEIFGKHSHGEIVEVREISKNNIKVKRKLSSHSDSTVEQSYTKKELFDLSNGKVVNGEELIVTSKS